MKRLISIAVVALALVDAKPMPNKEPRDVGKERMNQRDMMMKENWEYWEEMAEKMNETQVPDKTIRDEMVKNETKWDEYFTNLAGVWMYYFWKENKDNMMVM